MSDEVFTFNSVRGRLTIRQHAARHCGECGQPKGPRGVTLALEKGDRLALDGDIAVALWDMLKVTRATRS